MQFEAGLFSLRSQEFLDLPSYDLDTGSPTSFTEYCLADRTHQKLLKKQHKQEYEQASSVLQKYLIGYFENLPAKPQTKEAEKAYRKTQKYLQDLKKNQVAGS